LQERHGNGRVSIRQVSVVLETTKQTNRFAGWWYYYTDLILQFPLLFFVAPFARLHHRHSCMVEVDIFTDTMGVTTANALKIKQTRDRIAAKTTEPSRFDAMSIKPSSGGGGGGGGGSSRSSGSSSSSSNIGGVYVSTVMGASAASAPSAAAALAGAAAGQPRASSTVVLKKWDQSLAVTKGDTPGR
jgi:hypothetical protein